jgi:hypothetical protein
MTSRRSSGRGQPQATWKDPRRRPELLKAIGAGAGVVLITALIIFLIKPGSTSSSPTPAGVQTPVSSLPSDSTGTTVTTGSPTASSTPLPQP